MYLHSYSFSYIFVSPKSQTNVIENKLTLQLHKIELAIGAKT